MQPDLNRVVEQVSKEKGIEREIIVKRGDRERV